MPGRRPLHRQSEGAVGDSKFARPRTVRPSKPDFGGFMVGRSWLSFAVHRSDGREEAGKQNFEHGTPETSGMRTNSGMDVVQNSPSGWVVICHANVVKTRRKRYS